MSQQEQKHGREMLTTIVKILSTVIENEERIDDLTFNHTKGVEQIDNTFLPTGKRTLLFKLEYDKDGEKRDRNG